MHFCVSPGTEQETQRELRDELQHYYISFAVFNCSVQIQKLAVLEKMLAFIPWESFA